MENRRLNSQTIIAAILFVNCFAGLGIVTSSNAETAILTWDKNDETDLAGYRIYQRVLPSIDFQLIFSGLPSQPNAPEHTVTGLQSGTTYNYVVTAFDLAGNEGAFSNEVSKTISGTPPPSGPPSLDEDFADGNFVGWTVVDQGTTEGPSAWSASSGTLVQSSNINNGTSSGLPLVGTHLRYDQGFGWTDYQVALTLRSDDDDALGVLVRYQDSDNYYRFSWDKQRNYRRLVKVHNGVYTLLASDTVPYVEGQTYQVEMQVEGSQLTVRIDGATIFAVTDSSVTAGTVALYTWANNGARFDNVQVTPVTGAPSLDEDFADGNFVGWTVVDQGTTSAPSAWSASSGTLVQTSNIYNGTTSGLPLVGTHLRYDQGFGWTDYQVALTLRSDDDDALGVLVRYQDSDNYYRFSWDKQRNYRRLVKVHNGVYTLLASDTVPYVEGQTYQVEMQVEGSQLTVRIDGATIFAVTDSSVTAGTVGLYSWANSSARFDDVQVTPATGAPPPPPPPGTFPLTVSVSGSGAVTSSPGSINCPSGSCSADFANNTSVTLTATPGSGASLSQWGGACGGSGSCVVSMTTARSVSATFTTSPPPPGPPSLDEDFADGNFVGWTVVDQGTSSGPSAWSAASGTLVQSSNINNGTSSGLPLVGTHLRYDQGFGWTDYQVALTLRSDDDDALGVLVRYQDSDNYYRFSWDKQRNYRRLVKVHNGVYTLLASDTVPYVEGQTYQVEMQVEGSQLTVRIDGATIFAVSDSSVTAGTVGLYTWANNGARFDDVQVTPVTGAPPPPPPPGTFPLTVSVSGSGAVTSSPGSINCPSGSCSADFANNTSVTLTATPGSGASLSQWGGACGGSGSCVVSMTTARSVSATFTTSPPPSGPPSLDEDFADGNFVGWTVVDQGTTEGPSAWSASSGTLVQSSNINNGTSSGLPLVGTHLRYDQGFGWTDYQVALTLRSDDDDALGVLVRYQDSDNYYRFSWDKQRNYRRLVKVHNGVYTLLASDTVPYVEGQTYQVEMQVEGSQLTVRIDGATIFAVTDSSVTAGTVALYTWANNGARFDNVQVTPVTGAPSP